MIKEEQKQINSIQTFVVNSVKPQNQNSQNNQNQNSLNTNANNTSQISNFSNINISNENINTQMNSSLLNATSTTLQAGFCNNLERNKFGQTQNTLNQLNTNNNILINDENKMQIDDSINTNNNINFQEKTNQNPIPHIIQVQSHNNPNINNSKNTSKNNSKNSSLSPNQKKLVENKEKENDFKIKTILDFEDLKTGNPNILNPKPQLVDEYIDDIFQHLKEIEFNITTNPLYMKSQTDINEKMRAILIDWLVEVHLKFKLVPETLFLTVNLIDRYLNKKVIMRNRLQLVGVTAMLIACKYEEIYAPEVRDFVYITDKAYTKEEIFNMENDILKTLDFNVTVPSSFRYMEIFNRYLKLEDNAIMFCRYLLELFLIDYKMIKYNPSLLAASTMYITLKITRKAEAEKVTELIGYTDEVLKECAKDICQILDNVEKNSLQAIRNKFSLPKFMEVAKIKFN